MYWLGALWARGQGGPRDPVQACVWFYRCRQAGGDERALKAIAKLETALSAEQLNEAKARAREAMSDTLD